MQVGAMNHPMAELGAEIERIASEGFDFIDLTLEPEFAMPHRLNAPEIRGRLADAGLKAVGHTPYYLPLASPIPDLRQGAFAYFRQCLDFFAGAGIRLVNVHPYARFPLYGREWAAQRLRDTLGEVLALAKKAGVRLMLENMPPLFNTPGQLKPIFDAFPELGFHLDVGHANLGVEVNITGRLLGEFKSRVVHVHVNDNNGGQDDLHLPLGAGRINWPWVARMLRRYEYDGTVTLEVFSPDRDYLLQSREKWVRVWEEAGKPRA
ncbi:MAG: sugar phosphate isomerase/epimerase family protein [Patescibacteria group bacterium]